jgi:hypothetical protein
MRQAATMEAFSDWIWPTLFRSPIIMGILPMISITANSTMVVVTISLILKWKVIPFKFSAKLHDQKRFSFDSAKNITRKKHPKKGIFALLK